MKIQLRYIIFPALIFSLFGCKRAQPKLTEKEVLAIAESTDIGLQPKTINDDNTTSGR